MVTHRIVGRSIVPALLGSAGLAIVLAACGGITQASPGPQTAPPVTSSPAGPTAVATGSTSPSAAPSVTESPSPSQEPDTGGGTTSGDVPDNAVFLRYRSPNLGFSVQYVEGWQVRPAADGVTIADKDSSEIVKIVPGVTDPTGYVSSVDLPGLQATAGFKLTRQDTIKVGSRSLVHLAYKIPSPPDTVTGKQVPSTVDRYYVPGTSGLAIVTLSTPDGVDNVDAFRQMIESFRWA